MNSNCPLYHSQLLLLLLLSIFALLCDTSLESIADICTVAIYKAFTLQ